MGQRIDLNADLGEEVTDDVELLAVVTSANVACGFHAGNASIMRAVCLEAVRRGVAVGAQVSYADRANFGRVDVEVSETVLVRQVADQVEMLTAIAVECGTEVRYVKPHGALYNRAVHDPAHARAVLAGSGGLPVVGLPGSALLAMAAEAGRPVWREGFPDRAYTADGRLAPRSQPGAVLDDPALIAHRAVQMARSGQVDSVCVHGDSPGAVAVAREVRRSLERAGFDLGRDPA